MSDKETDLTFDAKDLDDQIATLKDVAARSVDACLTAKYVSLSDQRVRDLILTKSREGYVFKRIVCTERLGLPEQRGVHFDFDCKPGTLCLVDPSFLAVVNLIDRYVTAIVDPYLPQISSPATRDIDGVAPYGERTYLVLANHTFRDIHVQVQGDVHTGNWGPNQINHNSDPEVKSKKIDFGDEATYRIKVWTNNAGSPGEFVGEFSHGVRYNAAGNSDRLEFVIVEIEGRLYLRVVSVRLVAEVALRLWLASEVTVANRLRSMPDLVGSRFGHTSPVASD